MKGHIDKLSKRVDFDVQHKPIGAVQWDFICSIPEAIGSMIKNYEKGPECIFLHLTSQCTRKCLSCTIENKSLDFDDIDFIVSSQKEKRLNYVVLDGDPLEYKDINRVVDLLKKNNLTYSINSYSVPSKEFCEYVRGSVAKIQFKMNGIWDIEYTEKVVQALKLCQKNSIYTAIIFSIDKENYSKIPEIIEFCKKYGVRQFSFSRMNICHNLAPLSSISREEYLEMSRMLLSYREQEEDIHITSNDAIWKGCGACSNSLAVMPNGDIVPCAFLPISCGNIRKKEIDAAWRSIIFKNIRESNLTGKCGECGYKFLCKGCRALSYIQTGDYQAEDKGCWI